MANRSAKRYAVTKRRRLRARRAMFAVAATCSLAALGIGGFELGAQGWNAFLERPPGVGATPPQTASTASGVDSTSAQPVTTVRP